MTSKLNAALPTIVEAPSSPGQPSMFVRVSMTERRISGAEDPRAISVKFATVGFQTETFLELITCPLSSLTWKMVVVEVILSIPL